MCVHLLREGMSISINCHCLVDRNRIQTEEREFQMDIYSGEVKILMSLKEQLLELTF